MGDYILLYYIYIYNYYFRFNSPINFMIYFSLWRLMLLVNTSSYSSILYFMYKSFGFSQFPKKCCGQSLHCWHRISCLHTFLILFFKLIILVHSLKIVDASDLDSLLMYFSFIISCLCLNRYLSFERFFPFFYAMVVRIFYYVFDYCTFPFTFWYIL